MRQILLLDVLKAGEGTINVTGFFWFPVAAAGNRIPKPQFVSAGVSFTGTSAITAAEQAVLEDGSVREERLSVSYPSSSTAAQIKADLVRRYNDRLSAIVAEPPIRQYYGMSYDGTSWTT